MISKKYGEIFFSALFPEFCLVCQKEGTLFCRQHYSDLPSPPPNQAVFQYLDEILAITAYQEPIVQELIHLLKFEGHKKAGQVLSEILYAYIKRTYPEILNDTDWIIQPIPLYFWRQFTRGFNQSEIIAQKISPKKILKRHKYTRQQARLDKASRKKNIKNAFFIPPKWHHKIKNKSIVLIDDVVATGSTLDQAAKVFKNTGAKKVIAIVIARGG